MHVARVAHTIMARIVHWPSAVLHWHFCHLTCIHQTVWINILPQPKYNVNLHDFKIVFESSKFTSLLCTTMVILLKIEQVLNLAEDILNLIPSQETVRRVYKCVLYLVSLGYLTLSNDFFPLVSSMIFKCNIYHNECTQTSTTTTTTARAAKAFALSMLTIIQFQMILFSLPVTFHFTQFPLVSHKHTHAHTVIHQIQLGKCEFYPHSTTENM